MHGLDDVDERLLQSLRRVAKYTFRQPPRKTTTVTVFYTLLGCKRECLLWSTAFTPNHFSNTIPSLFDFLFLAILHHCVLYFYHFTYAGLITPAEDLYAGHLCSLHWQATTNAG